MRRLGIGFLVLAVLSLVCVQPASARVGRWVAVNCCASACDCSNCVTVVPYRVHYRVSPRWYVPYWASCGCNTLCGCFATVSAPTPCCQGTGNGTPAPAPRRHWPRQQSSSRGRLLEQERGG